MLYSRKAWTPIMLVFETKEVLFTLKTSPTAALKFWNTHFQMNQRDHILNSFMRVSSRSPGARDSESVPLSLTWWWISIRSFCSLDWKTKSGAKWTRFSVGEDSVGFVTISGERQHHFSPSFSSLKILCKSFSSPSFFWSREWIKSVDLRLSGVDGQSWLPLQPVA